MPIEDLTTMGRCDLWFILLLPFAVCSHNKAKPPEQLVKTIEKEADFTPVCNDKTQDVIVMAVCRIRPVRSREEECLLMYQLKNGFQQGCGSRFSLVSINQTLFLQLNNLTPENSGNLTCQCVLPGAITTLQLNITVKEFLDDEDPPPAEETSASTSLIALIGVVEPVVIIILLGFIYRSKCHRNRLEALTWHELSSTVLYKEAVKAEPDHFRQEEAGLYSKAKMVCC